MKIGDSRPTEQAVLAMWAAILPVAPGPDDDFFDIGGESLHLVRFLQEVYREFGVDAEVTELFAEEFTARRAAAVIARAMDDEAEVAELAGRLGGLPERESRALLADSTSEA